MSDRTGLLLLALLIAVGGGLILFFSIRDGVVRRHVKLNAFRKPVTGKDAFAVGLFWSILSILNFVVAIWLARYALRLPPG